MSELELIEQRLLDSILVKSKLVEDKCAVGQIQEAATLLVDCLQKGNSIYFAGNGGSAADAQHLAAELSGKFYLDRKPLAAEALHCNTSFITAVANDYSFDIIYARLLEGVGKEGDTLIGLSTSGNSKNVIQAFVKAKEMGIHTIALTGMGGGKLKELADICICIPSNDTPRIQECHITVGHIICELVENTLFSTEKDKHDI